MSDIFYAYVYYFRFRMSEPRLRKGGIIFRRQRGAAVPTKTSIDDFITTDSPQFSYVSVKL